jgi:hypothetical protein
MFKMPIPRALKAAFPCIASRIRLAAATAPPANRSAHHRTAAVHAAAIHHTAHHASIATAGHAAVATHIGHPSSHHRTTAHAIGIATAATGPLLPGLPYHRLFHLQPHPIHNMDLGEHDLIHGVRVRELDVAVAPLLLRVRPHQLVDLGHRAVGGEIPLQILVGGVVPEAGMTALTFFILRRADPDLLDLEPGLRIRIGSRFNRVSGSRIQIQEGKNDPQK